MGSGSGDGGGVETGGLGAEEVAAGLVAPPPVVPGGVTDVEADGVRPADPAGTVTEVAEGSAGPEAPGSGVPLGPVAPGAGSRSSEGSAESLGAGRTSASSAFASSFCPESGSQGAVELPPRTARTSVTAYAAQSAASTQPSRR